MSLGYSDVRSVVARAALLLSTAVAMLAVPELTTDPSLAAVLPGMVLLLALNLTPALWTRAPDLFAPPVYLGIITAFGTFATIASWIVNDELTLDLVRGLRTDEAVGYSQRALLVLILGTSCYLIGYYARWGVAWQRIFPRFVAPYWSRSRVLLLSVSCFAAFLVAYGVFQARSSVPLLDFTQPGAGKRVWHGDVSLSWMMRGIEIGFLPILLWFCYVVSARRSWRSLFLPVAVLTFFVLLGSRVGQRGAVTYVVVVVLVQFHYFRKRIPTLLFAVVCFVAVTISNVVLEWRNAPEDQLRTFDVIEEARNPLEALATHEGERQRFSATVLIMKTFPEEHPYLLGRSWASLAVVFVPRWVWPGKGDYFEWADDRIVWNLIQSPTPPPYFAAFYANLSWLGVVLLPMLFGMFHRGLYEWLRASGRDRNSVLMYALFLVYSGPSMLHVSNTIQYILPMWIILKFVSRRPDGTPETI